MVLETIPIAQAFPHQGKFVSLLDFSRACINAISCKFMYIPGLTSFLCGRAWQLTASFCLIHEHRTRLNAGVYDNGLVGPLLLCVSVSV